MKKSYSIRIFIALCTLILLNGCAGWGVYGAPSGGAPTNAPRSPGSSQPSVSVTISAGEARQLALAAGMSGRRALPPGIQRNLARGKALPPGIARQVVPQGMLSGLPRYPDHEWQIAGDDLILIAIGTLIVVEILEDVFR